MAVLFNEFNIPGASLDTTGTDPEVTLTLTDIDNAAADADGREVIVSAIRQLSEAVRTRNPALTNLTSTRAITTLVVNGSPVIQTTITFVIRENAQATIIVPEPA